MTGTITGTQTRLNQNGISDSENSLPDQRQTFREFYHNSLTFSSVSLETDNTLIEYCDIEGKQLFIKRSKKGGVKAFRRLRIHDSNQTDFQKKKYGKYKQEEKTGVHPFLNGLYVYFVRPVLLENKVSKVSELPQNALKELKDKFKIIAFTEGEFKAFQACKNGIPTIGLGGIHGAVKTVRKPLRNKTGEFVLDKLGQKISVTKSAYFIKEIKSVIDLFEPKKLVLLHDSDAFDNSPLHTESTTRYSSFFASPRNFRYAVDCYNRSNQKWIKFDFAWIESIQYENEKFGIDDLILKYQNSVDTIKTELLEHTDDIRQFIKKVSITTYNGIKGGKKLSFDLCQQLQKLHSKFVKSTIDTSKYLPTKNTDIYGKFEKYIGQSKNANQLITDILEYQKSILVLPPESGKSTVTFEKLDKMVFGKYGNDAVIIMVSPLNAITTQQSTDSRKFGEKWKTVCGGFESPNTVLLDFNRYVMTLASFTTFMKRMNKAGKFDDKKIIVVFDEFTEKFRGTYQNNSLLDKYFNKCTHVIGLTATNFTKPALNQGYKIFELERQVNPKINFNIVYTTEKTIKTDYQKFAEKHKGELLVFHSSTDDTRIYSEIDQTTGKKSEFYNAKLTTEEKDNSFAANQLISAGFLPENSTLHTTKKLELGVNGKGFDVAMILQSGNFDFVNILQSICRRRGEGKNVTLFVPVNDKLKFFKKDLFEFNDDLFAKKYFEVKHFVNLRNKALSANEDFAAEFGGVLDLEKFNNLYSIPKENDFAQFVRFDKESNRYFLFEDAIWNDQINQINRNYEVKDLINWLRNIPNSKINFRIGYGIESEEVEQIKEEFKEVKEAFKERLQFWFDDKKKFELLNWFAYSQTDDDRTKRKIKKQFPKVWDKGILSFHKKKLEYDTFLSKEITFEIIRDEKSMLRSITIKDFLSMRFKDLIIYLKRYFEMKDLGANILDPNDWIFENDKKYGVHKKRLNALISIELLQYCKSKKFDYTQLLSIPKYKHIASTFSIAEYHIELQKLIDKKIGSNNKVTSFTPLNFIEKHSFKSEYLKYFCGSPKKCNEYLKCLYDVQSSGKNEKDERLISFNFSTLDEFTESRGFSRKIKKEMGFIIQSLITQKTARTRINIE